jgi:hypothetical protein
MTDPKTPHNCGNENTERDDQEITQTGPSHMNQGNKTFYPDKQRDQSSGDQRENRKSEEQEEERPRKAS